MRSHTKFGPDRFSRFDVYWTQTDKLNLYIDEVFLSILWILVLSTALKPLMIKNEFLKYLK